MKKHVVKTKKQNQKAHAKEQFRERYGEEINKERYKKFISYIQNHTNNEHVQAKFIKKSTNRVSAYIITEDGKSYKCLYDKQRKTIITFLEERMRIY